MLDRPMTDQSLWQGDDMAGDHDKPEHPDEVDAHPFLARGQDRELTGTDADPLRA